MEADWQNGIVTYLNPAAELSFPELTAQHLDHPIFSVIKERLGSTTSDFQCEVIVKERIYEQKIYFLPGTGLIRVYSHDITQQKEIQKNLARLASFPEQNPSPIIEIDLDGNITYRNPACFRIFPDLTATDHPVLGPFREKFADLKAGTISSYSVEIRHNDRFYTQQAKIFGEYQVIRIFNLDITQQKHNEELIREKNKEITDSINYAKRIQDAKLPKIEDVKAAFHDSFILFKPKDIVSGDFYFFERKDDKLFIAAADCTGHGVPGAFMSLIGCEKLEDALTQTSEPSQVLRLLNTGVRASLRQSQSCDSTRDGMDIAFCAVDVNARTIEFAGANRPLWILNKDTRELREIRGTKTAIGGFTDNTQHFHTNTVQLSKGDTFYIFSDGYADTFGGTDEKKLTTKKFKEILLGICHLSMDEQKTYLDQFIETWKNGIEQIDDILVIGIRL
jgi:serine phosphatase RsbU (regulator of sigma subunit)